MFGGKKRIKDKLRAKSITNIAELAGDTKTLLVKNFFSGIFKGIGISIGFTLFSAIIVYFLQKIIRLNIPIISEYITDIVDIVEKSR